MFVVLIEYLTFGRRHIAKQVAQQIAQRAAFLVDQAIQEKVSGAVFFGFWSQRCKRHA